MIEGGTRASGFGAWPWVAVLGQPSGNGGFTVICGGTLVSDRHIVTAAHCFPNEEESNKAKAKAITHARVGDYDLGSQEDGDGQDVTICEV